MLLDRGAAEVVAVDVGYGQLAWSLRSDPRVAVIERTNVRDLSAAAIGGTVDLAVADLSFISLSTVLPALTACCNSNADIVPMVKPQFEVGRGQVGTGGVVADPQLRAGAVLAVARRTRRTGLAHSRSHRQPAAWSVRERRVLSAVAHGLRRERERRSARHCGATRRRGGPAMTGDGHRTVLLVVHPRGGKVNETAQKVAKTLTANGIALRMLDTEAANRGPQHFDPVDLQAGGTTIEVVDSDERAAEGCELSSFWAVTALFCVPPIWRVTPKYRFWGQSGPISSSPNPRPTRSMAFCSTSSTGTIGSSIG